MEDEGGVLLDGKALGNLRVVDLKQELEKRGLSKSGSKKDLVKRLKQQLEFEKLCGERKSTGDCDLKLELDADTEQNEFVQQYLAQQQKIYAEQKEVKRLIELEEVQKSGDERGSDSPKAEDASDHDTRDTSDNESPPEVFETVQAASSVQKSENKIDVDSSKMDEDDSRQKEIKKKDNDSEKIASPIKGGNVKQTTEAENPLSKIKAEEMPAQSDSNEEIAMTKVSKIEVVGTKNKESSNQIKSVENVGTIDHEVEVEEEDKKVESEDCTADENSEDPSSKNETKSSDQSPDNMETEPKTMVSNILDSFYVQPERKDEELISERSTVHSSEGVEIEPRREVSSPQHPSNEPAIENQNVSEQPSGENISTVLPSSSSVTDKSSENSPDIHVVMEPATEVSPVPYALSENKENVIKPVPKPVHEENVSEVKRTSKTDGYAKDTDSDSESKSPASEKELSEPEETLNFNGKSSRKKLVRGTSQETDNPVKEKKLEKSPEKDSAPVRVVDKSQLKNVTRRGKSKTKSRKYSEDSEEGEMKSGSESESGDSSDSSEHRRSRRKSRKGKRKVSRSKSSDSSRSRSRESRSVEKVVKRDNKGNSKANAGSDSKSHDGSKKSKTKTRKGKRNSREVKKRRSRSGSSNSTRSQSRDSSFEKVERTDSEGNSKVDADSVSKSHGDASMQGRSKLETIKSKQHSRVSKRKASRSESSNSSRSQSRGSSVEKVGRRDSEESSKIDASSFSKSHDDSNELEKSKPKTSDSKRGRQNSRKDQRKISRSGSSSSSRSRSRGSSVEKVERRDSKENLKTDSGSFSKSRDDNKQEKSKPETSDSKRGRQDSKKDQRKISRSGSSSSSRSRSRGSSVEKVERRDSKENLKTDSGSFSKSRDDNNKQEKSKPETSDSKRGRQDSKKDQRKISRSGSSSSSRSRSRGSSVEKVERRDSKENLKTDSGSFSKSRDDKKEQEKSKPKTSDSKQSRQRKISRSGSSSSSRSGSRGSSVEKVERRDSEENSKIDAGSFSKSRDDNNEQEKSKPKTSDSKRGRQNSRKDQRKISRSGSSSNSRSRSRGGSVEKVDRRDSEENSKIDAGSFSKSHDDNNEQEKSKPETSDSKRGRQDSKKGKRKISRSGSSSSSRSRSRDPSVEKVEKMETEENSKASASSVSKSHDDTVEKEEHKPETPQKRLKLKRDNVIVSDLPQATKKDTNEDKTPQKRKDSDAGVDETVEKNNAELTKQIEPQPVKYVSTRKIRISGRKVTEKSEDEPKIKRGKWGSYSSAQKPSKAISISTDSLKNWFPDFKLLKNPDISEAIEEMQVVSKDENNPDHQTEKIDESKHISQNIEMKDEQISEPVEQIDESEATNILFIQNLVRPFTLLQLKELLKETGNFIEEKFWIDKIKSKCFVTYSTVEEAIKTKTTLNGARWPSSNPKILSVEFSTEEDLQLHQSGSEPPKPLPPPPPVENPEPLEEHSLEDLRRKERDPQERRRDRSKPQPVREWDKNKLTQESPTRERISRSIERSRSSDKKEKKDSKRRPNEDTPAKLLDDLFQKTKSSPCIYWLPLTEEQVVEREEARRLRKLEREKRIQQREQEEAEQKAKAAQSRNRGREMDSRRSSTRSRSPVSRRR